jgi:hypothetical protein
MKKIVSLVLLAVFAFSACSSPRPEGAPEVVKNYLIAPYEAADAVESKLKAAGFDIVARVKPVKKKDIETFILTNAHLKALANRPMRGLVASVIRVTIDKELNTIQVTNPLLYLKAYLQDEYKVGDETPVIAALMKAFPNLSEKNMAKVKLEKGDKESTMVDLNVEQLDYDALSGYHFMVSMPYYQDMDKIGEAADMATLIKKLKKGAMKIKSSAKKKERLVYLIEIAKDRYVAGLRLSKRTEKFAKKIGYKNVGLLPWGVLLEMEEVDGKQVAVAKALNAKYRIALNYSNLDMGGFMGIMTVPGAITTELSKVFH